MHLLLAFCLLGSSVDIEEKQTALRLLQIESYPEALNFLNKHAHSTDPEMVYLHISALASNMQLEEAFKKLKASQNLIKNTPFFDKTLEAICVSIIKKHFSSEIEPIQAATLYPLLQTSDVKAVDFFIKAFHHPSLRLKSLALEGMQRFGDEKIKKTLLDAFGKQTHPFISKQIASLFANWSDERILPEIEKKLKQDAVSLQEKMHYVMVIKRLISQIDEKRLKVLANSQNGSERLMAAFLLSKKDAKIHGSIVLKLLKDRLIWVKQSALMTIIRKKIKNEEAEKEILSWKNSTSFELQKGYFFYNLFQKKEGIEEEIHEFFDKGSLKEKKLIASLISQAGDGHEAVVSSILAKTDNPHIRIQLALYLLANPAFQNAVSVIQGALDQLESKKLYLSYDPVFPFYAIEDENSSDQSISMGQRYSVDKSLRLKIFHLLAIKKHPQAKQFLIKLLKTDQQDLSIDAMLQFWQHFGQEDESYLVDLLKDQDPEIRFRAALVLNYLGYDNGVKKILIKEFPRLNYNMQIQILFSLSQKKDEELTDFFLNQLESKYPIMQSIAAGCLFNMIYN